MCLINMKQKFHNSTRARALSDSFTAKALEWKTERDMPLMRDGDNIKRIKHENHYPPPVQVLGHTLNWMS